MAERMYSESDWVVRRWDRFNARTSNYTVRPLSFCHFWRTVLLHETLQQLLGPVRVVERLAKRHKRFAPLGVAMVVAVAVGGGGSLSGENLVVAFGVGIVLGTVLGSLMTFEYKLSEDLVLRMGAAHLSFWRGIGHGLWLLAWPFRTFFPPVGRRLVAGVVTVGEPFEKYTQRHKEDLEAIGGAVLVVVCVALVGFIIIALLISNWLVTVTGFGILLVGGFAVYGSIKLGVPQAFWKGFAAVVSLLWGAAVAAKHGVCPPVTIIRSDSEEER